MIHLSPCLVLALLPRLTRTTPPLFSCLPVSVLPAFSFPLPPRPVQAVILSDRLAGPDRLPVPSLLAVGAVHQHLLTTKQRLKGAIFAEMGDAREVHDMATLIG